MPHPELRARLRSFFLLCDRHRMASSLAVLALLHLGVLFLWPAAGLGQGSLAPPAQVVHLTDFALAAPQPVPKTEELKIDDKKIEIGKPDEPQKTQKSTPTASGDNYLPFFEADTQPRPLIDISSLMTYPEQARRLNIQVTVVVELDISAEGEVKNVRLVRRAGWGFDEEVLHKIRLVRFRPALKDKEPIAVTVQLPIAFVLR